MKKRIWLFACLLAFGLAACGDDPTKSNSGDQVEDEPEFPDEVPDEPVDEPEEPPTPTLEITAPEDGDIIGNPRVDITGLAEHLDRIAVNDESVRVNDGEWEVRMVLEEGEQVIEATGEGAESDSVTVFIDTSPPVLLIETPERGTFVDSVEFGTVTVSGHASDTVSGVASVSINGVEADLADGAFQYTYTPIVGTNLLEIVATDGVGRSTHVTRSLVFGEFSDREARTPDAIIAYLREDGFDVLEEFAGPLIEEQLSTAISGALGSGPVEITNFSYGAVEMDLAPADGYIDVNLRMYDLQIDIRAEQDVWVTTIVIEVGVVANPAEISAQIIPTISETGVIGLQLNQGELLLHEFGFTLGDLPSWVTDLAAGFVADLVELIMRTALSSFALDDLFDPATLLRTIDLLGATLEFDLLVTEIPITPAGLALLADAAVFGVAEEVRGPGPLHLEGTLDDYPSERSFNLALAYNFINALLNAVWETGMLDINLAELLGDSGSSIPIPLNVAGLSLLVGEELALNYPASAPVILELRPLLPPVGLPELDPEVGAMNVTIGDMLIDFSVELEDGTTERWATLAAHLGLDIDLEWIDGGISPSIGIVGVMDLDDEPVFDLDDEGLEETMAGLMNMLPSLVTGALGEQGLGDFAGFELREMTFTSLEKAPYLVVGADLAVAEAPAEPAPSP